MFTGIIQKQIKIKEIQKKKDILDVCFEFSGTALKLGASVSLNGICSTVVDSSKKVLRVQYMQETIDRTTVSEWKVGDTMNFENSLKVGDTLDGHFVYGHIDTVGEIKSIKKVGDSEVYEIVLPKKFLKYLVFKGSVALDGISLTVSKKTSNGFTVSLIPYTLMHTTMNKKVVGDRVNVELDALGKYVLGRIMN